MYKTYDLNLEQKFSKDDLDNKYKNLNSDLKIFTLSKNDSKIVDAVPRPIPSSKDDLNIAPKLKIINDPIKESKLVNITDEQHEKDIIENNSIVCIILYTESIFSFNSYFHTLADTYNKPNKCIVAKIDVDKIHKSLKEEYDIKKYPVALFYVDGVRIYSSKLLPKNNKWVEQIEETLKNFLSEVEKRPKFSNYLPSWLTNFSEKIKIFC